MCSSDHKRTIAQRYFSFLFNKRRDESTDVASTQDVVESGYEIETPPIHQKNDYISLDDLLEGGDKRMYVFILFVLALCNACDAMETLSIAFILPCLDFSAVYKSTIASAVYGGMLFGGLASGYGANRIGRRALLFISLLVEAFAALAGSVLPLEPWFIVSRVVNGIGIGATVPVIFSYAGEVFPWSIRERFVNVICASFTIGSIFVSVLAWAMLSLCSAHWRFFYAATSILPFVSSVLVLFIPESPFYQLKACKQEGLLKTLKKLGTPVDVELIGDISLPDHGLLPVPSEEGAKLDAKVRWSQRLMKLNIAATSFVICYVWYGVGTWVISLFEKLGIKNAYASSILYAASGIVGVLVAIWVIRFIDARALLFWSLVVSAIASAIVALNPIPWLALIVAGIFNSATSAVFNGLMTYQASAKISNRTVTIAGFAVVMRISSMVAQYVIGYLSETGHSAAVHGINAGMLILAAVLTAFLPAYRGTH